MTGPAEVRFVTYDLHYLGEMTPVSEQFLCRDKDTK